MPPVADALQQICERLKPDGGILYQSLVDVRTKFLIEVEAKRVEALQTQLTLSAKSNSPYLPKDNSAFEGISALVMDLAEKARDRCRVIVNMVAQETAEEGTTKLLGEVAVETLMSLIEESSPKADSELFLKQLQTVDTQPPDLGVFASPSCPAEFLPPPTTTPVSSPADIFARLKNLTVLNEPLYREVMPILNPTPLFSYHTVPGKQNVEVVVVRDDMLQGGTKQRALASMLLSSTATEFVYAGPNTGFAQVALAYSAKICGKESCVVVGDHGPMHPLTQFAARLDAKVETVRPAALRDVQEAAKAYTERQNERFGSGHTVLLPFGMSCEEYKIGLTRALNEVLPRQLLRNPPKRMWMVAGSATLLAVLRRIFPTTKFMVVQVGKTVWPDQLLGDCQLFVAPESFITPTKELPPYPSVATYDAKIWQFVLQLGEDGDYIWNVGADKQGLAGPVDPRKMQQMRARNDWPRARGGMYSDRRRRSVSPSPDATPRKQRGFDQITSPSRPSFGSPVPTRNNSSSAACASPPSPSLHDEATDNVYGIPVKGQRGHLRTPSKPRDEAKGSSCNSSKKSGRSSSSSNSGSSSSSSSSNSNSSSNSSGSNSHSSSNSSGSNSSHSSHSSNSSSSNTHSSGNSGNSGSSSSSNSSSNSNSSSDSGSSNSGSGEHSKGSGTKRSRSKERKRSKSRGKQRRVSKSRERARETRTADRPRGGHAENRNEAKGSRTEWRKRGTPIKDSSSTRRKGGASDSDEGENLGYARVRISYDDV